ncbi:MAG: response regulator transcription factor [Eubacteriaceae bacterium]
MNDLNKVVMIEDSSEVVDAVSLALQIRWPHVKFISSDKGRKGLSIIERETPNLIILDLGLPDINGFDVLKDIRNFSDIPVLILTVRGDESDIVRGLELGADAYIIKPFRQMELLSRIHAILRRQGDIFKENYIAVRDMNFNPSEQILIINGRNIELTRCENIIFLKLIKNPDTVVSHSQLAETLWGIDCFGATDGLKVHIRRLRQKIEKDPNNPQIILTRRGLGYVFSTI